MMEMGRQAGWAPFIKDVRTEGEGSAKKQTYRGRLHGFISTVDLLQMRTGVQNTKNFVDVLYGRSLAGR